MASTPTRGKGAEALGPDRKIEQGLRKLSARLDDRRRFDVGASRGTVALDLVLLELEAGEIEIALDIDHDGATQSMPPTTRGARQAPIKGATPMLAENW